MEVFLAHDCGLDNLSKETRKETTDFSEIDWADYRRAHM